VCRVDAAGHDVLDRAQFDADPLAGAFIVIPSNSSVRMCDSVLP
jgi:hypothetical protein